MNNVISTKISVYRNLKDYKFVPKLDNDKKGEIIEKLTYNLKSFEYINIKTANEKTLEALNNAYIEFNTPHILVDKDKKISISLFDGEHITINAKSIGYDKGVIKSINNVLKVLNDKISMSYSDEYGYLMSDISKIGSGLKITSEICLPNLKNIGKIEQVQHNLRKLRYNLNEVGGDTFSLSTICNLGFTENEIVAEFEKMLIKLDDLEKESAKMIDVEHHDELVDQVNRCIAILNTAHLMSYRELRGHISTLRTARNLGLSEISVDTINKLQELSTGKNEEFITTEELIALAKKTKEIIKGV